MTRRTTSAVAAATLASALLLTGCGTQDALVGLRPAPAEKSVSAPLGDEGAADIAARVLAQAEAPIEGDAKKAAAARAVFLAGDALTVANACLLYTSDAADERSSVDLGGRRSINKKKKKKDESGRHTRKAGKTH